MNTPGLPIQPAAAAPAPQTAAPAASSPPQTAVSAASPPASTDFLLMLAQLLGVPAPQAASPGVQTGGGVLADGDSGDLAGTEEMQASELSALASLPLPIAPLDVQTALSAANLAAQSAALSKIATDAAQGRSAAVAFEAQILTELIRSGESGAREPSAPPDLMQLPAAATEPSQIARATSGQEAMLSRPVHSPVGSRAWADEIGARMTVMVEQGRHSASLRLSPENLGPLEIRIAIRDDQASVWFGAAHADTRAAIEHALPRLRELLESQGLSLADAGVFREPPREPPTLVAPAPSSGATAGDDEMSAAANRIPLGLIDAYA